MRFYRAFMVALVCVSSSVAFARGIEPINDAANNGRLAEVKRILAKDPSKANFRSTGMGYTPLLLAAAAGHGEVVKILIATGADPNVQNNDNDTALIYASMNGRLPIVKMLLAAGAKTELKKGYRSALSAAAQNGHEDVVEGLLEGGAKADHVFGHSTALRWAIIGYERRIAEILLRRTPGAEVYLAALTDNVAALREAAEKDGASLKRTMKLEGVMPIHLAALGDADEALSFLLERGVDVATWSANFSTPLHMAAGGGSLKALAVLIDADAPLEAADISDRTPILRAAENKRAEAVRLLAEAGADVAQPGYEGRHPIHMAVYKADLATLKTLLDCGADPNAVTMEGDTPLHVAAKRARYMRWAQHKQKLEVKDFVEVAKLLLEAGASTRVRNARGITPDRLGVREIASVLRAHEARVPAARTPPDPETVQGATKLTCLDKAEGRGHVVVLAPFGETEVALLEVLAADLRILLGITVLVEANPIPMPEPKGATRHRGGRQWTEYSLKAALNRHAGCPGRDKVGVLGVTREDIFDRGTNYIFASGHNGIGIMSYRRFLARDRERLLKRMRNQGVATTASMFGVSRCRNRDCPCAYTRSLADHDMKGARLCAKCAAGFEKKFGVRGGEIPDPDTPEPEPDDSGDVF